MTTAVPDEPFISVILPVHNGMPYLPAAVESVLCQTFGRFELLVIDDGSTDETPVYLRSLTDPRVRVERLEKVGLPRALNHGLELARGRLVARLDADDIAYPTRLEKQAQYFDNDPECVLISCHFDCIDSDGHVIGDGHNPISDLAARWMLLFTTPFVHPGAMFVREEALAVGGYDARFRLAQDYELWTRLATRGRLGNYPEKLIAKRLHGAMHGGTNALKQRELASGIAGTYAPSAVPGFSGDLAQELYRFLWWGEPPVRSSPATVVAAYVKARRHFLDRSKRSDPELLRWVRFTDGHLRERCLGHVRQNLWQPWSVMRWLSLARAIDPIGVSFARLIGRLQRLVGLRQRTADQEVTAIGVNLVQQGAAP